MELGTYIGYSAIATASKLPAGGKLYGIDPDAVHVKIARQMIEHAGLSQQVEIIEGVLETVIPVSISLHMCAISCGCTILACSSMRSASFTSFQQRH